MGYLLFITLMTAFHRVCGADGHERAPPPLLNNPVLTNAFEERMRCNIRFCLSLE